ncbi:MAG TPA: hypothetical protein VKZ45_06200 [Vicingaceae bacterium]|nr:hypothetical protein [Vicingaceae bacterium]
MTLAPIILFTYKRLDTLQLTVDALKKNYLAKDSDLIIFSDAAKTSKDQVAVNNVRTYLKSINGFKSITINEAKNNKGLANSIIDGVSLVLQQHESVIVLEDDLVSSPNFLNYMNEALSFYKNNTKIFSIAGFSIPIITHQEFDVYFTNRANSTGWATWRNRWEQIDWEVSDYDTFKNSSQQKKAFNKMGSDMASMLHKQMTGKLDSWAIRWCYHQFKNNLFSVHPIVSKIDNVGFTPDASNTTEKFNRFKTNLDQGNQTTFKFTNEVQLDSRLIKQFVKPFTITSRIKYKILNLLP